MQEGEWRILGADWARPAYVACGLCGRPLFGRAWTARVEGEPVDFCDPACETLLHDYWQPRYRPMTPTDG